MHQTDPNRQIPPIEKTRKIADEPDMQHIGILGKEEGIAYSSDRINELLLGCTQWLAVGFSLPAGRQLIMFKGQIERLLRLILINTRFFQHLNREYSDYPAHYQTLHRKNVPIVSDETIDFTIGYLEDALHDNLCPELLRWKRIRETGLLVPAGIIDR